MPETLEAEVIAIDGKPPEPTPEPRDPRRTQGHRAFHGFRGRVVKLDRRWWPLWLLLGLVFGVFIIDRKVCVTRYAKCMALHNFHTRKQPRKVCTDNFFNADKRKRVWKLEKSRKGLWQLHSCEALFA